ncbi:hypothetical protein E4U03_11745 [Rothia nasimurium]|uniref:PrgI family protein n=1 Tax=Rothia nasimurium TaxID=85336 RepID=A0A4Y9F2V9_9MICC|nr:SCO6880 family protein [Rothia nasimurium]MBF0809271.1 hypothetical protein [Rothia nasimurium]TFU20222.1 hypothetical protein E4U03_11745 [Rothia nasimurium]
MMEEKVELTPVRIPRQEKGGIILGLSLLPLLAVGFSIAAAMTTLFVLPFPASVVVFFLWLVVGAIFGWVRIKNRTLFEWIPALIRALVKRLTGQTKYVRPSEKADMAADMSALDRIRKADEKARAEAIEWNEPIPGKTPEPIKFTLPGIANEFQLYQSPAGRGVLHDPVNKRAVLTLLVKNTKSFDLQDESVKATRITDYGNLLDVVLANRLVEAVIPTDTTSLQSDTDSLEYFREQKRLNQAADLNPIATQGYEDYLTRNLMTYHMQYYTVVLSIGMMRSLIKEHGSNMSGLLSAVDAVCDSIDQDFSSNNTAVEHWLSAMERRDVVYENFTLNPNEPIIGAHAYWSKLRANACWHRSYVIEEWPQKEITPGFMSKVTKDLDFRHSVSIVYEAGYSDEALRKVNHAIQDKNIALRIKEKSGQRVSLEDTTEMEDLEQRETELVAGYGEVMMRGFMSITATSEEELERYHSDVMSAAKRAGLVMYECWDQQFAGFLAAGCLVGVGID